MFRGNGPLRPAYFLRRRRCIGWFSTLFLISSPAFAAGHQHINAGALGSEPGTRLSFLNGDRFAAESGYVLPCLPASTGPHAGFFRAR